MIENLRQWIEVCEKSGIGVPEQIYQFNAYTLLLELRIAVLMRERDRAKAEAFEEAAKIVREHLIYTGPGGYDPEPMQSILSDVLKARALSSPKQEAM